MEEEWEIRNLNFIRIVLVFKMSKFLYHLGY